MILYGYALRAKGFPHRCISSNSPPIKPSYGVVLHGAGLSNCLLTICVDGFSRNAHISVSSRSSRSRPACMPLSLCIEVLDGIEHFKNHFAAVHEVNL